MKKTIKFKREENRGRRPDIFFRRFFKKVYMGIHVTHFILRNYLFNKKIIISDELIKNKKLRRKIYEKNYRNI